jgi:uncharacterized membrane protein (DUF485 family)
MAKKDKKKKGKGDPDVVDAEATILDTKATVSKHPRARRSIRTIKAWAALIAFILVEYKCVKAGMTFDQSVTRALLAGIAAYVIAWVAAVIVWRQLVVAEIEALRRRLIEAAEAEAAAEDQTPSFS